MRTEREEREKNMDFYGFYTGQEFEAYKYLGAHYTKERTTFRTFAPSAAGVELVLNGQGHGMQLSLIHI